MFPSSGSESEFLDVDAANGVDQIEELENPPSRLKNPRVAPEEQVEVKEEPISLPKKRRLGPPTIYDICEE
jgi:hypothetical protein